MNTSNPYEGARLPGFVGTPLPGVEIRLLDPETGALIDQPDQTGAIEIRGPNVCAGYWRDRQKTISEMRPDGWFKSGDIGRFNREGYLQIVGRAKDMLITGGYNVYPKELEQEIDSLAGVLESAVIGLPHGDLGEAVTAIVVANPDAMISEAGIIAALQIRLARYKVPRRVLVVSELPRNTMGKVQKNLLRERHAALYET
jgi:malonyl-CoA/methylmalonyl-CoA synthetase